MKVLLNRLLVVVLLTFVVSLFIVCYPFLAVWYLMTGIDLTKKLDVKIISLFRTY